MPRPIVETKPFERDTFCVLFEHCPNPYRVRELGLTSIIALLHEHQVRCGPVTAQRILDCANRALLSPREVVTVYIQGLEQPAPTRPIGWHARPGPSNTSKRGSPPRQPVFDWPDGISHRGDPFHRQTLVWMARWVQRNLVAGHHPTFGLVFQAAEARGLGVWGAAIHTAHKLNRVCFRLLAEDRPYVDDTRPEDFTRWRTYWIAYRQFHRDPKQFEYPGPWHPLR